MLYGDTKELIFLESVCTHNIWGGSRLREEFGYPVEGSDIGECWGISAHPGGDAVVRGGIYTGKKLSQVWDECPELFGSLQYDKFPLMTKIIDAQDDLSIQVHPDDAYAREHEGGESGKMECWYIIDCREGATIIAGHNAATREELYSMAAQGKWQELIREIPIKKGDFIQIDPGRIHAIKADTLIFETEQNSDVTYRLYDYDRLWNGSRRELCIDKGLEVVDVPDREEQEYVKHTCDFPENTLNLVHECDKYTVFKLEVNGAAAFQQKYPFLAVSVIEGEGMVNEAPVKIGNHFIMPCGYGSVEMTGNMKLMLSTVGTEGRPGIN